MTAHWLPISARSWVAEWRIVPGQQCLQRFLGRLLCMKDRVPGERRYGGQLMRGRPKIHQSLREPRPGVRGPDGIMRHGAAVPHGGPCREARP